VRAFRDLSSLRLKNLRLEKDKLNLELDFLKAQVNPHFLFNTLNSVYARVFDSDEQAADLVLRLSELMRYNLYESDVARIALDKELSYVQNYLDLERNRLSDQYVVIDYEQSGNPATYQIVPLLLITFVENAFKHGVKGATEPAYVQVSATVTAGQLVFRVENSVPRRHQISAMEPPTGLINKSGGIGLGNVRRRLDALYKDRYELITTLTEDTYTVLMTVQVEKAGTTINANV
jgi:two-component system, LytTR family, sensor kinase